MSTADTEIARGLTIDRALRGKRIDGAGLAFQAALLLCLLTCLAFIVTLIATVVSDGGSVFQDRGFVIGDVLGQFVGTFTGVFDFLVQPEGIAGWLTTIVLLPGVPLAVFLAFRHSKKTGVIVVGSIIVLVLIAAFVQTSPFLTGNLSRIPERAGVAQAIFGSVVLAIIVTLVAFPLGIATAVYLEEYAATNKLTAFVRLNIRNLAGVPSVVYGLLGLTIFVQFLGTDWLGADGSGQGLTGGRTLIAGGLTLAVLVLPIVIITASEAIIAVPDSLREGGYGVGATKWEVNRNLVLPNAMAGILTGTVLSLARAIGETAPLILVGAFFGTFFTTGDAGFFDKFTTTYTALPQVVFQWATDAKTEFRTSLAAAAIIVLLAITLIANLAAVLLRNRYEKKW